MFGIIIIFRSAENGKSLFPIGKFHPALSKKIAGLPLGIMKNCAFRTFLVNRKCHHNFRLKIPKHTRGAPFGVLISHLKFFCTGRTVGIRALRFLHHLPMECTKSIIISVEHKVESHSHRRTFTAMQSAG